jgi:hypothetical protein
MMIVIEPELPKPSSGLIEGDAVTKGLKWGFQLVFQKRTAMDTK